MKKIFSLFAALTLSVGLWADEVITYTATTSLQELFNNQEKFEPAPMSNDYAEGIGTVTFPNLLEIRDETFKDCSALTSITLPASIERIGSGAFANCENLQSVTCKASQPPARDGNTFENVNPEIILFVPALSVEAYQMFWGDFSEVQALPIAVGDQFKEETTGLYFEITSLGTPKTVKVIQSKFINYSNSSYNIPSSVTYSNAEYTVTEIGYNAFYNCGNVTSITLPSTITTIGENAFRFCVFSSIDLPAALIAIGNYAFSGCKNLQSIIVPANVTTIEYYAFNECTALQEVTFLGNACQNAIGNNVFYKVGATTPATLTLSDDWTGTKPDAEGNWYGGKFAVPATFTLTGKSANQYATICLPQPIASVTNGTLYKISYGNKYEVHFVEETNFTAAPAGTPYLVQAEADGDIVFTMADAEPVTDPVGVEETKGFVASLQEEMQAVPEGYEYLLVSGGALHSAGAGCLLSKNHAYIDVNYVPETEPVVSGAPRRVTLYNVEAQSPTGLGQSAITNHKSAMKVVKNGQFVIIRDNMKYNAQGVEIQ